LKRSFRYNAHFACLSPKISITNEVAVYKKVLQQLQANVDCLTGTLMRLAYIVPILNFNLVKRLITVK